MLTETASVVTQASDQYLAELVVDGEIIGNAFMLKEDILIEFSDRIIVLDTKYKEIDRFNRIRENKKLGISDSDMKQMAIYAAKRGAQKLFLLYPLHLNESPETIEVVYNIHLNELGAGVDIPLEIIKVPFAIRESEKETRELLESILQKVAQ
jgi:5-methylcytosine-specific restriction enzyme subunit McrC